MAVYCTGVGHDLCSGPSSRLAAAPFGRHMSDRDSVRVDKSSPRAGDRHFQTTTISHRLDRARHKSVPAHGGINYSLKRGYACTRVRHCQPRVSSGWGKPLIAI